MKLHENQLSLIRHLTRFNYLDYEHCLKKLETEDMTDVIALSYAFRPLTKNNYISKNNDGIVSVLRKGRALFPEEKPLISSGWNDRYRIIQISRMAALMERNGVTITDKLPQNENPHFIPSPCWRNIAPGILSTTRFVGMLLAYGKKYAVYDIGDGRVEWQVRAESSLFYTKYGSYETKADGMILICDDDKRKEVAEYIIRQTMWNRKSLLSESYTERERPVRFSRSPIKLRTQYEHVYLTTPAMLHTSLSRIYDEERLMNSIIAKNTPTNDPKIGDFEQWPCRYFINSTYDLLKLVYFFSAVKMLEADDSDYQSSKLKYGIIMHKKDLPIVRMYEDVFRSKKVIFCEFTPDENS